MGNGKILVNLFSICLAVLGADGSPTLQSNVSTPMLATPKIDFKDEATRLSSRIETLFWDSPKANYISFVSESGQRGDQPAFCWDMAIYLSSQAAASRLDRKNHQPLFDRAFALLQGYADNNRGVFGYSDFPRSKPDRYYDDNEWLMLALLDMYGATRHSRYLEEAKKLWPFIMSGMSDSFGGGIFWRENERNTKNTCSNAPAIAAAAGLYLATKETKYLEIGERLHHWISVLKDRDNLMLDHIGPDGKIEQTKWSYNTALMIRSDLLLFQATHSKPFLEEAVAMGAASVKHWVDPATGAIHDESSFAHHLAEAFLTLGMYDHSKDWRGIANRAIGYAFAYSERSGLYGSRWDRYTSDNGKVILRYQASMARALWMAASGSGEKG
jgi:predicted alpha-1,6-mannanase (GH76 family)